MADTRAAAHSPSRRHALALTLLVVLPALWWSPLLVGFLPDFMDTVTQLYPYRLAVARQFAEGTLPLWLPNQMAGMPLAANPQVSTWYPPQILFYLAPGPITNGILCLFHYVLGGIGMYLLVRRITGNTLAAFYGAFTFQFGAMMVSRIALTPHLYTAAWIPWMLLGAEIALRERRLAPGRGVVLVAVAVAMQLLAGSPQITFYTALALPIWWIGRALVRSRSHEPVARVFGRTLANGLAAALLAALLASVQLIPTLEYVAHAERSTIPVERLVDGGLKGGYLWRALLGLSGTVVEDTDSINAIGIGAIAFALLALVAHRRRKTALVLWGIGILAYLLSLSVLVPLWSRVLPLYSGFHAPRRALILWSVVGPVLAGLGVAAFLAWWRLKRFPRFAVYVLLLVSTAGVFWMLPRLERALTTTHRFDPGPVTLDHLGDERFLAIDPSIAYSYDSRRADYGASLMPNLAAWHDVFDANGYDPLVPARIGRARDFASRNSGNFYRSHGVFIVDPSSPVLELLAVNRLVGRYDWFDPSVVIPGASIDRAFIAERTELLGGTPRWPVFAWTEPRPLAWFVEQVLAVPEAEDALLAVLRTPEPRRLAAIELGTPWRATQPAPAIAHVERPNARTLRVTFTEPTAADQFLVVSTTWMPGWRGRTLAGDPVEVLPTNGFLMGVRVPAGAGGVVVDYLPASFVRGAFLSLGGLLLLVVVLTRSRRPSARLTAPPPPHQPSA